MKIRIPIRRTLSFLLSLVMLLGMLPAAAVAEFKTLPEATAHEADGAASFFGGWGGQTHAFMPSTGKYTYNDWVGTLSENWNPHTYGTSDESYPMDFLTSGLYSFVFNDERNPVAGFDPFEGYVIVPEMAASLPVDVTEQIKDEGTFSIPEDATSGYAYTIDLNPDACWEDGTPITAEDYVESMKRLLDPKLRNYRASGYYEGNFCIAGAEGYANSGLRVLVDNL